MKSFAIIVGIIAFIYMTSMLTRENRARESDPDGYNLLLFIILMVGGPALGVFLLSRVRG